MELFHQSFNCNHIDHTKHKVYISFQISCRVFLGLSAYKNVSFPLNSSNDASFYFMCERADQAIVLVKISKTISVLGRIRNNLTVDIQPVKFISLLFCQLWIIVMWHGAALGN